MTRHIMRRTVRLVAVLGLSSAAVIDLGAHSASALNRNSDTHALTGKTAIASAVSGSGYTLCLGLKGSLIYLCF